MSDGHTQAQVDRRFAAGREAAFQEMATWDEDRLVAAHKKLLMTMGKKGSAKQDLRDMCFLFFVCSMSHAGFAWAMTLLRAYTAEHSQGGFLRMMEAEGSDIPSRLRKSAKRSAPPAPPSID